MKELSFGVSRTILAHYWKETLVKSCWEFRLVINVGFDSDFKWDLVCEEFMAYEALWRTWKQYAIKFLNLISKFKVEDGLL